MLSDISGKCVSKYIRSCIFPFAQLICGDLQFGSGLNGGETCFAHLYIRLIFDYCKFHNKSAAFVFLDIITAFTVLLRRIIFNESDADDLWLRRLSCSVFSQECIDVIYGVVADHSWLISHDSLPSEQTTHTYLAQLSSSFDRNTWFSQQSLPSVVHTTRGSMAGMPLADIIYALASSRVLDKFHSALSSEGLTSSIVGRDNLPFQLFEVAYCDDTAVPVVSEAPVLVDKTSH